MYRRIFYLAGGTSHSSEFSDRFRYVWLGLKIIPLSALGIGAIENIITAETLKIQDIIYVLWMFEICVFTTILLPFIVLLYSREFLKLFCYIENHHLSHNHHLQQSNQRPSLQSFRDSFPKFPFWFKIICVIQLVYSLSPVLYVCFFVHDKKAAMRNLQHHIIVLPFVNCITSITVFLLSYGIEIALAVLIHCFSIPVPLLATTIARELNDIVIDHCRELQILANDVVYQSEKNLYSRSNNPGASLKLFHNFQSKLQSLIRKHQELLK